MATIAMTRFHTPTPTRGAAPSHSPPDMMYAPGNKLAQKLGWFSIGLGLAELLAPDAMADLTGVRRPALLQAYGLREIVTGIGILSTPRPAAWLWGRVAGDVLDLATLADAEGGNPGVAAAAVAGVTVLDIVCAAQLSAGAAFEG